MTEKVEQYYLPEPDDVGAITLELPIGAEVVYVDSYHNGLEEVLFVWARVDPDEERGPRRYCLVATGEELRVTHGWGLRHVGSFNMHRRMHHLFQYVLETP